MLAFYMRILRPHTVHSYERFQSLYIRLLISWIQKYTPLTFPFNVLSTENTIKDKITKIFHFITENTLLANTFPYYTCWNLLASKMAAVNFRCEAAASKTSKEWPFCSIPYSVPAFYRFRLLQFRVIPFPIPFRDSPFRVLQVAEFYSIKAVIKTLEYAICNKIAVRIMHVTCSGRGMIWLYYDGHLHYRLNFDLKKSRQKFHHSFSILQSFVAKCFKMRII